MANQNGKSGILGLVLGVAAGAAAVAAGYFATAKIVKEINNDSQDTTLVSPNEKNLVTITCGSSLTAKGLTFVKIKAANEKDTCNLNFLTGKSADSISFNWEDDDHIEICIGENAVKQVCYVSFEGEEIQMTLCAKKDD